MPLATSPHLLPATEIFGDVRPQEDQKDIFSPDLPVRTQISPSTSPHPYEESMSTATADRAFAPSNNQHIQQAPMIVDPESMQWSAQCHFPHNNNPAQGATTFCTSTLFVPSSSCIAYPQQAQNGMAFSTNYALNYPPQLSSSCPRVYNGVDFTGLPSDLTASYPPATFLHSPPHLQSTPSLPDSSTPELMQFNDDYDLHYGQQIKHEEQLDYNSPYSDISRVSTPYSPGHEDDNPIDKEQPYAQLIYRALLDAPENTMVLRDIYDWFRRYTDKASQSETKGWQNSIRHNLSMNGAFEKVDAPSDATNKGFMWRLTPAALREGVKSTTRYRSKAPNKRSSGRTQPLPQRQASGAKGGHAARRAANLRRSQHAREAMYGGRPTSVPFGSGGYGSDWEGDSVYTPSSAYLPRVDTPYTQYKESDLSFLPYQTPKSPSAFQPMLGLASHLISPPRSYASTPITPNTPLSPNGLPIGDAADMLEQVPSEPLFARSPTPSADEPITSTVRRSRWEQDVAMGIDVFDDMSYAGGASGRWEPSPSPSPFPSFARSSSAS